MKVPASKIPEVLNNALLELTNFRDELRRKGKKKSQAIKMINIRVKKLVPNHNGSTPAKLVTLIHKHGMSEASAMLRSQV